MASNVRIIGQILLFSPILLVSSTQEIFIGHPSDLEKYGFACSISYMGLSVSQQNCSILKVAPTSKDLPQNWSPMALSGLEEETNLMFLDYELIPYMYWTFDILAPVNITKNIVFESELYYDNNGVPFNPYHLSYGRARDYGIISDQYSLLWLNVSTEEQFIPPSDFYNFPHVGFHFNMQQHGVYRWFRITIDPPREPLLCSRHQSFTQAQHLYEAGFGYPGNNYVDAATVDDLPWDKFNPEFLALLQNETDMMYLHNTFGYALELKTKETMLFDADKIQFAVEVFEQPGGDPWNPDTPIVCWGLTRGFTWDHFPEVDNSTVGWKRYEIVLSLDELSRYQDVGFHVRRCCTAVFRKFEVNLLLNEEGDSCKGA